MTDHSIDATLCFNACMYPSSPSSKSQKIRGSEIEKKYALQALPLLLGMCSGMPDARCFDDTLLQEFLEHCGSLAMVQLWPGPGIQAAHMSYSGPIALAQKALHMSHGSGSADLLLAMLDNHTQIHGKQHPMAAILS